MIQSILACLLLSFAALAQGVEQTLLVGVEYRVASLNGEVLKPADGYQPPTILLDGELKRASGSAGINRYGAGYVMADGTIRFEQPFSSMMAGPDEAMRLEGAFLRALGVALRIEVAEDSVVLTGEGCRLVLQR